MSFLYLTVAGAGRIMLIWPKVVNTFFAKNRCQRFVCRLNKRISPINTSHRRDFIQIACVYLYLAKSTVMTSFTREVINIGVLMK